MGCPRYDCVMTDADVQAEERDPSPCALVVMGVCGAGKTEIGRRLAEALRWTFVDAEDFHPPANVEKTRAGTPLTDADRVARQPTGAARATNSGRAADQRNGGWSQSPKRKRRKRSGFCLRPCRTNRSESCLGAGGKTRYAGDDRARPPDRRHARADSPANGRVSVIEGECHEAFVCRRRVDCVCLPPQPAR